MPFAAALSTAPDTDRALAEVVERLRGNGPADLLVAFYSPHHADQAEELAQQLAEQLGPRALIGCAGESIIGTGREVERSPALSLWSANFPAGVTVEPFHLVPRQTPDGLSLLGWPDGLLDDEPSRAAALLLADPFTFPLDVFLPAVHEDYTGLRVVGGMASGSPGPGQPSLIADGRAEAIGAVGVLLRGPVGLRTVVSQGCRPIGRPFVITKAQGNVILEIGGRPPLEQLRGIYEELGPHEQNLFQQGLHVGLVIDEYKESFGRGDFLVRNLMRVDRASGAIAVGDYVRVGQTVQFHVRDADTASEELHDLLRQDRATHAAPPAGALIFSCNGRGTRLFDQPHHDAAGVAEECGAIPTAGFFAAGELGPVGGQTFVHGFTASIAVFEG